MKEDAYNEKNRELDIMRKLIDPNVVTYYINENVGPHTYIVMELASDTLENIIKNSESVEDLPVKK